MAIVSHKITPPPTPSRLALPSSPTSSTSPDEEPTSISSSSPHKVFLHKAVESFLDDLPAREAARCSRQIDLLKQTSTRIPQVAYMRDGLWELKLNFNKQFFRFLFGRQNNDYIIVHAFKKKENKTRKSDMEIAFKRLHDLMQ